MLKFHHRELSQLLRGHWMEPPSRSSRAARAEAPPAQGDARDSISMHTIEPLTKAAEGDTRTIRDLYPHEGEGTGGEAIAFPS